MERLTYRLNDQFDNPTDNIILMPYLRYEDSETRKKILNRLAAYEETGMEPEEIKVHEAAKYNAGYYHGDEDRCRWIEKELGPIDHLRDLIQAEQDSRLVVLPCKVGATVYGNSKAEVYEYKVAVISLATYNWYLRCQNHNSDFWVTDADIGKTVFLTREEAEAALEAMKDE